jgi:chlorite dismutase
MRHLSALLFCVVVFISTVVHASAEVDREQLSKGTEVYATFATFKASEQWWQIERHARAAASADVKKILERYVDRLTADVYLMRGLSERADILIRIHSNEMIHNQNFLLDMLATNFGKQFQHIDTFNGITKALNYVPNFPGDLQAELKTPPPQANTYVIVVPIRKDSEWWITGQDSRTDMMKEHTDATIAYLKTVKRKLYHSSGLDDWDFITYFETSKLNDFNNLVTGLLKIKENRHNRVFGDPLLLGTIRPLDEILEILAR